MHSHSNNIINKQTNFSQLPNLKEDQIIHSLPPLPFFKPAQQPLTNSFWSHTQHKTPQQNNSAIKIEDKNRSTGHSYIQLERSYQSNNKLKVIDQLHQQKETQNYSQEIQKLEVQISNLKKQVKITKDKYYKKQVLCDTLEKKRIQQDFIIEELTNHNKKLQSQLQILKGKKRPHSRVSLGDSRQFKKKNIPVIKITVPNLNHSENDNQEIYKQLKNAGEQINNLKKILENQKHKHQYSQLEFNKALEKNNYEKQHLVKELNKTNQQLKILKIMNQNLQIQISQKNHNRYYKTYEEAKPQDLYIEKQQKQIKLKQINQQLKRNDMQKELLKVQLNKLKEQNLSLKHRLKHFDQMISIKDQRIKQYTNLYQKNQILKKQNQQLKSQINNLKNKQINEQTVKKNVMYKNELDDDLQVGKQCYNKHFQMSINQIKVIEKNVKDVTDKFIQKITKLTEQNNSLKKLKQFQDFQIKRIYEVIKNKKQELEMCYQENARLKKSQSLYLAQQSSNLDYLLHQRRNHLF